MPAEEPSPADAKSKDKPAPETAQEAPADPVQEASAPPAPVESDPPIPQTTEPESESGNVKKEEMVKEVVKGVKGTSPPRVVRRLSARVGELFKAGKSKDVETPAKVDEGPPKTEEPTPVAPLENPAPDSTPNKGKGPQETEAMDELPKIIDATSSPVATSYLRAARRISVRVGELFEGRRTKDVGTPAKVDEEPPKIEEPTPVAPLENPAADSTPANDKGPQETKATNEPPKITETTPSPVATTARRISVRVGKFFTGKTKDVETPAKVDEEPPKIEEPTPLVPLENPAADSTPANDKGP